MVERPIRVLVVEDNPTDALLVRTALAWSTTGRFEVTEVDRLQAALNLIREQEFDVILLDLALPDSQGLETYRRLRNEAGGPLPAVIVVSGLRDEAVAVEAVRAGAQDYLLKSYEIRESLPRVIRYAIERRRAQEQVERYAWELRLKNKEMEDELRMAREIQQALLPHQYPRFSNGVPSLGDSLHFNHCYRPASSLSGDFFDVLHLSDTEAGVFICDVMGHGPRAALIGALTRGLIEQLRPVANEPGSFLTALNQDLSAILKRAGITAFVTAFYMVANLEQHRLRYSNAGHPSPFLQRRSTRSVNRLRPSTPSRNPPLGLLPDCIYTNTEVTLVPGDSIIMFTDGLYEVENAKSEAYGRRRLLEAVRARVDLSSEQLFTELLSDVRKFSGRQDFEDDVCLVAMDVTHANGLPQGDGARGQKKGEDQLRMAGR